MAVTCQSNQALKHFEFLVHCPFIPNMQKVSARRHIGYRNVAGTVGHPEESGIYCQDHSQHVRMQFAEDVRGTGAVEAHRFLLSPTVRAEIESFAPRYGEYAMEIDIPVEEI